MPYYRNNTILWELLYWSLVTVHHPFHCNCLEEITRKVKIAMNPHHALTYWECNGCCCTTWGLVEPYMRHFCVFITPSKWEWVSSIFKMCNGQYSFTCNLARKTKSKSSYAKLSCIFSCCTNASCNDKVSEFCVKAYAQLHMECPVFMLLSTTYGNIWRTYRFFNCSNATSSRITDPVAHWNIPNATFRELVSSNLQIMLLTAFIWILCISISFNLIYHFYCKITLVVSIWF